MTENIKDRNKRVEIDKAWETSLTRRSIITIEQAYLTALVPTGGYILSTISIEPIKKIWISKQYRH